ncbi:hypothetical protein EVAR_45804_1 [Eumeta japonica]|uniref:Uncharacterized protein n=1 Tax=Eumeta variegata TaxID=151549 RepID=A0A4C1X3U8_EUMVA|nr:hypothetical protein EVAR_45804_1 [Eumeta japonica]
MRSSAGHEHTTSGPRLTASRNVVCDNAASIARYANLNSKHLYFIAGSVNVAAHLPRNVVKRNYRTGPRWAMESFFFALTTELLSLEMCLPLNFHEEGSRVTCKPVGGPSTS